MRDIVRKLSAHTFVFGDVTTAKRAWALFRAEHGVCGSAVPLLTEPKGNTKLRKTGEWSLALAPADRSGVNVCRFSTPECRAGCVAYSGKGGMAHAIKARVVRTLFLAEHPDHFMTLVSHEIARAKASGPIRMRLNAFSDIPWETVCPQLFVRHADVQFYDYTKWTGRVTPANYRLTQSCSERTADSSILSDTANGRNVAVVFRTKRSEELPAKFLGVRVIDGDKSDNRYDDPHGVIVGLRAKGAMRTGVWHMTKEVA